MMIKKTSSTFVITSLGKTEEYRDEWMYPIFVCTTPETNPSEFHSVMVEDHRDPLIPLLIAIYCSFLFLSALFTGLNLSLMSLDMDDLRRIREYDENPKTRRYAANIIPIRENGNFMLCTILLGNTICNAICVLTFDRITRDVELSDLNRMLLINVVPAIFIIVFSEILPQVICTKYALQIGSRCRHLMVFFMVLTFPASYPLSMLLDFVVGKETRATMNRRMLGGLMRQQKNVTLTMAELVENAMNLQVRRVRDVMTPIEKVFMLSDLTEINDKLKGELAENRHTRIPVFRGDDRNSVIGVLNVKDLLLIDDTLDLQIGTIIQLWHRSTLFRFVTGETPVAQLMLELKRGFPLAIVIDYLHDVMCYHIVGIVTLEDNLEEVIGEIYDEKDVSRALEMHMEAMTAGTPLQDIAINVDQDVQMKQSKSKVSKKSVDVQDQLPVFKSQKSAEVTPLLPASANGKSAKKKKTPTTSKSVMKTPKDNSLLAHP